MPTTPPSFSFDNNSEETHEIEIFPYRFLSPDTLEILLNKIIKIDGVLSVTLQGQRLTSAKGSKTCACTDEQSSEKNKIYVQSKEIELSILVGRIILEVLNEKINEVIEKIKNMSKELLPFGYSTRVGKFTKDKQTLSDHKREWFQKIS